MKTILLHDAINAVNAEPELPGEMSDKMKVVLQKVLDDKDLDLLAELMRIVVKATKKGIRERIKKLHYNDNFTFIPHS